MMSDERPEAAADDSVILECALAAPPEKVWRALTEPGLLAKVATVIGENGGNIIEVAHNRMALDVPAKGAEFDILIETRDAQHTQEIIDALRDVGYPPRTV